MEKAMTTEVVVAIAVGVVTALVIIFVFICGCAAAAKPRPPPPSSGTRSRSRSQSPVGSDGFEGLDAFDGLPPGTADTAMSFAETCVAVKSGSMKLPGLTQQDMLRLYGLYKQATEVRLPPLCPVSPLVAPAVANLPQLGLARRQGPCTTPKPSMLDFSAHHKWGSWAAMGQMDRQSAEQNYVAEVHTLAMRGAGGEGGSGDRAAEAAAQGDGGAFGGFGGGGLKGGVDAAGAWYDDGAASTDGGGTPLACGLASSGNLKKLKEVFAEVRLAYSPRAGNHSAFVC